MFVLSKVLIERNTFNSKLTFIETLINFACDFVCVKRRQWFSEILQRYAFYISRSRVDCKMHLIVLTTFFGTNEDREAFAL